MITIISNFTQSLLSTLKEITNALYYTQSVELYDGRFENFPESVSVSKLTFFVDIDAIFQSHIGAIRIWKNFYAADI